MSILISCGFSPDHCAHVQMLLEMQGLKPPLEEHSKLAPREFARRFGAAHAGLEVSAQLGEAWKSGASEIVLANAGQSPWGWSSPDNLHLMDFWMEFEPNSKFLISYSSPADVIAHWMTTAHPASHDEFHARLAGWHAYYTKALNFYQRNSDKTVLVSAAALTSNGGLNASLTEKLNLAGLGATGREELCEQFEAPNILETLIAEGVVQEDLASEILFEELEGAADFPNADPKKGAHWNKGLYAWEVYKQLRPVSELELLSSKLELAHDELKNVQSDFTVSVSEKKTLASAVEDLEARKNDLSTEIEGLKDNLATTRADLSVSHADTERVSNLLKAVEAKRDALSAELDEAKVALSAVQHQNEDLRSGRSLMEEQLEALKLQHDDEVDKLNVCLHEKDTDLAASTADTERVSNLLKAVEVKRDALSAELEETKTVLRAVQQKSDELLADKDLVEEQMELLKLSHDDEVDKLNARLREKDDTFLVAQENLQSAKNDIVSLDAEKVRLTSELGDKDQVLQEVRAKLAQSAEAKKLQLAENELLLSSIDELRKENAELSGDIRVQWYDLKKLLGEYEASIHHLHVEKERFAESEHAHKKALEQAEQNYETRFSYADEWFKSQLSETKTNLVAAEKELERLLSDLRQREVELVESKLQNDVLSQSIVQATDELERKTVEHQNTLTSIGAMDEKLSRLLARFDELEDKIEDHGEGQTVTSNLDKALENNKLLNFQLQQIQGELEYYFKKYQELSESALETDTEERDICVQALQPDAKVPAASVSSGQKGVSVDMRHFVQGNNWHDPEQAGRWAGPGVISTLKLPKLDSGAYRISVHLAAAMAPDIFTGMRMRFEGKELVLSKQILSHLTGPVAFLRRFKSQIMGANEAYPATVSAEIHVPSSDRAVITLEFPRAISPSEYGEPDPRKLTAFVTSIELTPIVGR